MPGAVLQRMEWSVLVFFASLFVLVGGLEAAGIMSMISSWVLRLGREHPVVTAVSLVWIVGVLSAVIDNVPITVALNIFVTQLAQRTRQPITTRLWNRRGLPVMILTCLVSSLALALDYALFTR